MIKIIDFYADWCKPCQTITPILEQIENEYPDLQIKRIDVDQNDEVANHYNIRNIPTLIFFKDDVQVDKIVGAVSKTKIIETINLYI